MAVLRLILKICDLAPVNGAIRDVRKQEGTACKILKLSCVRPHRSVQVCMHFEAVAPAW